VTAVARSQRRTGSASLNWLVGLIVPVALIAAWQVAKSAGALPYTNVPSPLQIWDAAVTLARNGQLQGNFGHTIAVCLIGWAIGSAIGAAAGVALGLALALNVDVIVPFLEQTFGFHFMDPDVYYISGLPSEVHPGDVVRIGMAAFILTLVATVYPALQAARTQPAEALRYE
jgi:lipoprotein-releasing system permease protein